MEITLGLSRLHGWLLYPLCLSFLRKIKFVHKGNTNTTSCSQARPALVILESSIDDICKSTTLPFDGIFATTLLTLAKEPESDGNCQLTRPVSHQKILLSAFFWLYCEWVSHGSAGRQIANLRTFMSVCSPFNSSVFELLPFSQTYVLELAKQHKTTERTEDLFHPVVSSNLTMSHTNSHG